MVEDLTDTHPAPLTPPHRSAFAVALSAEGATLFERAAAGGELPFGVVYDLRFLALSPSLNARVTMDYERIYDRFAASVGFTYYVSVKLDVDLAWLLQNEAITIEITAFSDAEDARRQQERVLDLVKARVVADFFRSGIPPRQEQGTGVLGELLGGMMGGSGEVTSASAFFVLKARYEAVRETRHHEMLFAGRTAVELPHTAVGLISTLAGDEDSGIRVEQLDLDDPFFSALDVKVASAVDFESLPDLTAAAVHLAHGDHRKSFELTPEANAAGRFQVPLTDPRGDEYTWEAEYHFDPALQSMPPDGRSFLPQLLGKKSEPREWAYFWYAPDGGATPKYEFAMSTQHKLYRDGTFIDLTTDWFEEKPLRREKLSGANAAAAQNLQAALDQFADARPARLLQPMVTAKQAKKAERQKKKK
jgi:hypothetical protein